MAKTLIVRMVFIYMISSFFRRSPTPVNETKGPDGKPVAVPYSENAFPKDALMVQLD